MHWTAIAAMMRVGNYWHMLPESTQARRSLWQAVNPHTGLRRIDEVFPLAIRDKTLEQEMMIRFKNGSTWQVIGSNNYLSLVGAPPIGVVFSEWSKAHPQAWAYLSPILLENGGWAIFPTTPMGKNHAYKMHQNFVSDRDCFAQTLRADHTNLFAPEDLEREKKTLIDTYGYTLGMALYAQEYECSAEAAILGAVYGTEIHNLRTTGRLSDFEVANAPVYTAWDLGRTDATAIWWFQIVSGEVRILDYYESHLQNIDHYIEQVCGRKIQNDLAEWAYGPQHVAWGIPIPDLGERRGFDYAVHYLPHDAAHKTLGNAGTSIEQMVRKALKNVQIVDTKSLPMTSQYATVRSVLNRAWIRPKAETGLEVLALYRYGYDETRNVLSQTPIHDFSSHCADAMRILSLAASSIIGQAAHDSTNIVQYRSGRSPKRNRRGSGWAA